MKDMTTQMELTLNANKMRRRATRLRRRERANWWFAQMRTVVDAAVDWRPAPASKPQQVYLALSKRS